MGAAVDRSSNEKALVGRQLFYALIDLCVGPIVEADVLHVVVEVNQLLIRSSLDQCTDSTDTPLFVGLQTSNQVLSLQLPIHESVEIEWNGLQIGINFLIVYHEDQYFGVEFTQFFCNSAGNEIRLIITDKLVRLIVASNHLVSAFAMLFYLSKCNFHGGCDILGHVQQRYCFVEFQCRGSFFVR